MKKQFIIALGAVMLLSGCNGGENVSPEESEVSITEAVSEKTDDSRTTEITTTSENISESEPDRDMPVMNTENEMKKQISSDSDSAYNESEGSMIEFDEAGSYENKDTQESETAVYVFGDYLERDND